MNSAGKQFCYFLLDSNGAKNTDSKPIFESDEKFFKVTSSAKKKKTQFFLVLKSEKVQFIESGPDDLSQEEVLRSPFGLFPFGEL